MTLTNPPTMPLTGTIINVNGVGATPAFGKPVVDSLNELDTRTTDASTGNTQLGTRVGALETTVNATGVTAAGNAALSSRLGTGVTTASTATAQLALKAPTSRLITAGTGLTGGGDLSADRTLTVAYGNTATTAASGDRALALETIAATHGRWVSTSNASTSVASTGVTDTTGYITSEQPLGTWAVLGNTPSGISVSGQTFTVANAGRYNLSAQMFFTARKNGATDVSGQVGFSIKNPAGTILYGYTAYPFNTATATALLTSVAAIDVTFAAGATFQVFLYGAPPVVGGTFYGAYNSATSTNQGTSLGIHRIG